MDPLPAEQQPQKIDVAKEVLTGILDLLAPDDSFAIVLFSNSACAPQPLGPARCTDIPTLKQQARPGRSPAGTAGLTAGLAGNAVSRWADQTLPGRDFHALAPDSCCRS